MPSGYKNEVINNRERAVSNDINRLQAFFGASLSQVMYEMFGKYFASDDLFPGTELEIAPGGAPPFHGVLNGLRAYPVNGSINLLITPGVAFIENTGAGSDDAPFMFVQDPGITVAGSLQLSPAPGATRIDVLECQSVLSTLESDNRDIYNVATGLFAPALVSKVQAYRMSYRLRAGTPGAGFPGWTAGWMPLMVASVPAAAATWDACELWDVRALVSEYWNSPYGSIKTNSIIEAAHLRCEETAVAAPYDVVLTGALEGKYTTMRVSGVASNHPTGMGYIDISKTTANHAAGYTPGANAIWYLYLAFPNGMGGWRKYNSSAFSPRVPTAIRGIPIVTQVPPAPNRYPTAVLALPTATGLGGTTVNAVCVAAGITNAAAKMRGFVTDGRMTFPKGSMGPIGPTSSDPLVTHITRYTLTDNTDFPACAKAIRFASNLSVTASVPPASGDAPACVEVTARVYNDAGTFYHSEVYLGKFTSICKGIGGNALFRIEGDIPLNPKAVAGTHIVDLVYSWDTGATTIDTLVSEVGYVYGWKLTE